MNLPEEIELEIREIFADDGEELLNSDIQEITSNLLNFALSVSRTPYEGEA